MGSIFVAGASGFVGAAVVGALLDAGYRVKALARRADRVPLPARPGLQVIEGDALVPGPWRDEMRDCAAVINCIGIIREYPRRGITFERLHVEANARLLEVARAAGVPRYLLISAHGARPDGVSRYQTTKFRAEEELRASGLSWTIFRPSLVIGPGVGFLSQISPIVRFMPVVPLFGDGLSRYEPVDRRVLASSVAVALAHRSAPGSVYEFRGERSWTYRELLDAVGAAWGRKKVRKIALPLGFVRFMIAAFGWLPFAPITRDQLEMLVEADVGTGPDASKELGVTWIPLEESLRWSVQEMRRK